MYVLAIESDELFISLRRSVVSIIFLLGVCSIRLVCHRTAVRECILLSRCEVRQSWAMKCVTSLGHCMKLMRRKVGHCRGRSELYILIQLHFRRSRRGLDGRRYSRQKQTSGSGRPGMLFSKQDRFLALGFSRNHFRNIKNPIAVKFSIIYFYMSNN